MGQCIKQSITEVQCLVLLDSFDRTNQPETPREGRPLLGLYPPALILQGFQGTELSFQHCLALFIKCDCVFCGMLPHFAITKTSWTARTDP